jgi:cyclic pyranopterin phosphate synthase
MSNLPYRSPAAKGNCPDAPPSAAGLVDGFGRAIRYLRISVTDRCNLRCAYCMPPGGVPAIPHDRILSYEAIAAFAAEAVARGIDKIRLTGGEPLVRRGLDALVRMLAAIPGLRDLSMTTNGTLLARHARALRAAGLQRVNVSIDAVDPARYARITRGGDVRDVLAGLDAARAAGLVPVKLNCVVESSGEEPDAREVAALARDRGLAVRFIPRMDLARGRFGTVVGGMGGRCDACNRLRLSSDGWLRPCLFSDFRVDVRAMPPAEALRRCVEAKPARGTSSATNRMHAIGG